MDWDDSLDEVANDARPRRRRVPRTFMVAAAVACAVVVVLAVVAVTVSADSNPFETVSGDERGLGPVSGAQADPLPIQTLPAFSDGDPVDVGQYLGEPLLVNFWATWCAPCLREMPMLRDMSQDLTGDVTFLGINVQDIQTNAEAFIGELDVDYDQASDPNGDYFRAVGGLGMPTTLLVDEQGLVRYRHTGELDADGLRDLLRDHLGIP